MPVAAFAPSRLHYDYPEWTAPASGSTDTGKAWVWNNATGVYEPASFLLASAVSAFGLTLIDDADAATARTTLGLGTAAVLDVGTSANNIVQLNGSAQLPAVDGSLLTGISGGSVAGSDTQVIFNDAGAYAGDAGLTYAKATDRLTVVGGLVAPSMRPATNAVDALQWQDASGNGFVYGDTTNLRLGIGISAPFSILHVATTTTNPFRLGKLDNNIDKGAYISSTQYSTSTESEGWQLFGGFASSSEHRLMFGGGASALNAATNIRFYTAANITTREGTERIRVQSDGKVGIGTDAPVTLLDIAETATSTSQLTTVITMRSTVSASPLAGFGVALRAGLKSSTTADQDAGRLMWEWGTATHASRAAIGKLTAYYTSTERRAMTWGADSSGALLSFGAVTTPIAIQVLATGASASVDDVIQALQNLGLVKQS